MEITDDSNFSALDNWMVALYKIYIIKEEGQVEGKNGNLIWKIVDSARNIRHKMRFSAKSKTMLYFVSALWMA